MLHFNYMKFNKVNLAPLFIIVLSFFVGAYFYQIMPPQIASHWGINGEVNGYLSKFWGVFFMPILSVFLYLLFIFLPKTDPYKKNFSEFKKYFDLFLLILFGFLFYIYITTILWNLGFRFNMIQILSPAFAVLFYYIGVLMSNTKRNWFVGIRTPWTLSNEKVWIKTHKLGSKLFKAAGLISLLSLILPSLSFFFILVPVILFSTYLFIYSYLEFQKIKK